MSQPGVSKRFHLSVFVGAVVLFIALTVVVEDEDLSAGIGGLVLMTATVIGLRLMYKAWKAIQDGRARTTPGRAVGFLFIPMYNLYWLFNAVWGYAVDYNLYLKRYGLRFRRLPEGLFAFYCLLWIAIGALSIFEEGAALIILMICVLAWYLLMLYLTSRVCDAVNALHALASELVEKAGQGPVSLEGPAD